MMEAANTYYNFGHAPGFWVWLAEQVAAGTVRSVSLVEGEIDYPQELVDWVTRQATHGLYIDVSDPIIQSKFTEIVDWIVQQPFGPEHIAKFLSGADPWIVAAAAVQGATVVTQEIAAGPGAKKIKIPNVCQQFGVPCINTFQMNDALNASF